MSTTSENALTPEPAPARPPAAARVWLAFTAGTALVWAGALAVATARTAPKVWQAAVRGATEPAELRIQRASGLSPALLAAIRTALPADGRLVLYSPYGGKEFEVDGADPRGEPARQVRTLFERAKNLLYPHPRDVHFARDPGELQALVQPALAGRLLVVDGTQGGGDLAIGGRYELLHTQSLGSAALRLWRLAEVR